MLRGAVEGIVVGFGTGVGRLAKDGINTIYTDTTSLVRQSYDWLTSPASRTQTVDARLNRTANNPAIRKWVGAEFDKAQQKKEQDIETRRFRMLSRQIDAKMDEVSLKIKDLKFIETLRNRNIREKLNEIKLALNFLKSAKTLAALRLLLDVKKSTLENDPNTKDLVIAIYEPVELEKTLTEKMTGKFHALFERRTP